MTSGLTPYVELHCHSCYSLQDGTATPEVLVHAAADLDMEALALTDHNAVYGALPFVTAARDAGIHPILGTELTLESGQHLTLLVEDATGWRNLCRLISIAQAQAPKGEAALPVATLDDHTEGLICLTGCRQGPLAAALRCWDVAGAAQAARHLRERFGPERCYVEVQHHLHPGDAALVRSLCTLARDLSLPLVATNNVHYARRADHRLHALLSALRQHTPLDAAGTALRPNSEYYLKPGWRLRPLLLDYPEALAATQVIAARCTFQLAYGMEDLPCFPTPPGVTSAHFLAELCRAALPERYSVPSERVCQQLAHELRVIEAAGLSNYLLIVWDIVRWARAQGIRCQGRGSAANSLVAYLLAITPIDPLAHDLVFGRFLSEEHPVLPDIDLDIAADRREEVIAYLTSRYGAQHAALACTFSSYQKRSALRDVAFALGVSLEQLLTGELPPEQLALAQELCAGIEGLPRHLGQHSGGMVLTRAPLAERVPTEPTAMAGRTVVQWDKDALEEAGLVKIDLLGLRMLSVLSEAEQLLAVRGTPVVLDQLPVDDPQVYAMIAEADTLGVFQVESRAQAQVLPRLKPSCFADLLVAISLIRPGPLQGNMVHPYLRRRQGLEPISYLHPRLQGALAETLGVILFQEQVLKVARDLAGFSEGQGEQLRRALGGKQGAARLTQLQDAFRDGAAANGVSRAIADAVWTQLAAFGGYAFPKSHAAAFAVLVYQSAWLKRYHPDVFLTGLLNHQPMGFWPPAVLVRDARRHGVRVRGLDVQRSDWRCQLRADGVHLGWSYVLGLGEAGAARITAAQPFADLEDLCRRTRLPKLLIERLILAGACDGWGVERRQLLWQLGPLHYAVDELDLPTPGSAVELEPFTTDEAARLQQELLGIALDEHPLARWRAQLQARGILSSQELSGVPTDARVTTMGTLVVHQAPPTAKGHHFLTLEDEYGLINVILRPHIVARYRQRRTGLLLRVEGRVQQRDGLTNIIATELIVLARG